MPSAEGNASAGASAKRDDVGDYQEMADTLDDAIVEAKRKIESGRVYDSENEKVRIKWIRALAYAVNVRRQVTTDRDLEELTAEVEQLKEQQGDSNA